MDQTAIQSSAFEPDMLTSWTEIWRFDQVSSLLLIWLTRAGRLERKLLHLSRPPLFNLGLFSWTGLQTHHGKSSSPRLLHRVMSWEMFVKCSKHASQMKRFSHSFNLLVRTSSRLV
jgi:hypothetical protein